MKKIEGDDIIKSEIISESPTRKLEEKNASKIEEMENSAKTATEKCKKPVKLSWNKVRFTV